MTRRDWNDRDNRDHWPDLDDWDDQDNRDNRHHWDDWDHWDNKGNRGDLDDQNLEEQWNRDDRRVEQ